MITYFQAIIMGLLQGVTELFPISSLGHSVLLPSLLGWHNLVAAQADSESFFLAFLVGLHVATAIALLIFYRDQWKRIITGFFRSLAKRRATTPDERLAWLLVVATIPAALVGIVFEHSLRVVFAKPLAAAIFLIANGLILFYAEYLRRQRDRPSKLSLGSTNENLANLRYRDAGAIGVAQVFSLLAGISRSGITMVGGLVKGLNHEDAARFSFLLATPVILGAGLYKLPDLLGPLGAGVRPQILLGSLAAGLAAYVSVRFLDRFFHAHNLIPFAVYCTLFGLLMVVVIH